MLFYQLNAIFNPERFQGWRKTKNYFEGWYFKLLTADKKHAFAIIPGIAMDKKGAKQAFVQVLDGKKGTAQYFKFDANHFNSSFNKFEVSIKENFFSAKKISLNLPDISGTLTFSGNVPWPSKIYSPGIMGPFTFVPFMECYHGIISLNHTLSGLLNINGESIDFSKGLGYIEKDWGRSFPKAYVWMQTNHFQQSNVSLKISVAKIPWLGISFNGFIAGIWLNNKLYQFTTYNNSNLKLCKITRDKVQLVIANKNHQIQILANRNNTTELASPVNGLMDGKIEESMNSKISVLLRNSKTNELIFEGIGEHAALEVAGKVELLTI